MDRSHGTTEQRLERLERLDGETQERLSSIERLVGLVADDPVLGRQALPKPEPADQTHRGSQRVETKTNDGPKWHWPEW